MFSSSSTHLRHWIFNKLDDVHLLREETNLHAREKYAERVDSYVDDDNCLSVAEELIVLSRYQSFLENLCDKTEPPVPKHTRAVAVTYLRRFYLHHSVIDFHPREVMLTAIWIAMKVEEFNLSLAEFGRCIPRNAAKYMEIIRSSELFLIERLNYDLLVHVPTRAVDGMVAEWRAYLSTVMRAQRSERSGASDDEASMQDDSWEIVNERACNHATESAYRSVHTDAIFVLTPSQIALSALQMGIEHCEDVLLISRFADFVLERLCEDRNDVYDKLMGKAKEVEAIVKGTPVPTAEETVAAEEKLDRCRNPEFNFDSDAYKAKKRLWTERYEKL